MTEEICSTPCEICARAALCAPAALSISCAVSSSFSILPVTAPSVLAVSSARSLPSRIFAMAVSISSAVCLAASADLPARLLTSSATTAKPLPASPAREASTAAFSARIFVWNAMSSITLIILPISSDDRLISSIAASIFSIWRLLSSTFWAAVSRYSVTFVTWAAVSRFFCAISCTEAESSSEELACSVLPWASSCAPSATCFAPESTCSADDSISAKVRFIFSTIVRQASEIGRKSFL